MPAERGHHKLSASPFGGKDDTTMAKFFAAAEADPTILSGKTIAVIGYGNQGRAQAINLRHTGHHVIVGNQKDESWQRASDDGFEPLAMDAAAKRADIILLLLPDEIAPDIYRRMIEPHLARGNTLVFASGYNITYKFIVPPPEVDVILVAPCGYDIPTTLRDMKPLARRCPCSGLFNRLSSPNPNCSAL